MKGYRFLSAVMMVLAVWAGISREPAFAREPGARDKAFAASLAAMEARIRAFVPDRNHAHDVFGLAVVRQALEGLKAGSGGIGACLVDESTGAIVERGRNRQFTPYFRSDLHAEMDLLNRYEDRLKKSLGSLKGSNPRDCANIVLFSSMEPCPMCLARILNSGIKKMYYLAADPTGGMVARMENMPPFWRSLARDRDYGPADCSPVLREIARDLFNASMGRAAKPGWGKMTEICK